VTHVVRHLLWLAVIAMLAVPSLAQAGSGDAIRDCRDGKLDGSYSNSELRQAIDDLPTELLEYSDCRDLLSAAMHDGPGGNGGSAGGGPGGSSAGTGSGGSGAGGGGVDADGFEALTGSRDGSGAPSVSVGGEKVTPGSDGVFDLASASNSLPTPLVIALIALALLTLAGMAVALRSRVPALARIPLLSKIPTPRVSLPRFRR
jgi:hypothetical protein